MKRLFGWGGRIAAMAGNRGGPWGGGGSGGSSDGGGGSGGGGDGDDGGAGAGGGDAGDGGNGDGGGGGPRNPWGQPGPRRRRPGGPAGGGGEVTSLDAWLKRSRERMRRGLPPGGGEGGGGFGGFRRPYILYGLLAFAALWVAFTSVHSIGPQERGVVQTFGRYDRVLEPGINFTWPAPISRVDTVAVEEIQLLRIPNGENAENLILTGDQNVVDLRYTVRWNIKSPQQFLFQLRDPGQTIRDVAESAMRAVVARKSLDDALGVGRDEIAQDVQRNMQALLDEYGSGIQIQGVAINQSQAPTAIQEAFNEVTVAQQKAQSEQNNARAYALQRIAQAQGDAAQFEQIYRQYRAAPDVTRRRIYYETMEQILSHVDKTIVEANVASFLPLPALRQGAQPAPAPAEPQPAQPAQGGQGR